METSRICPCKFFGLFKGKEQVLNFFQNVAAENEFKEFATDTFIADGDHCAWSFNSNGKTSRKNFKQ